jgi:hypothetical protein
MNKTAFKALGLGTILLISLVGTSVVQAQTVSHWGVRAGVYFDETEFFLGVEALMPMTGNWYFNPNIEHAFGDQSLTTINADIHYDFRTPGTWRDGGFLWVGAGIAALLGSDSDIGVNLLLGYGTQWGAAIPYVQLKGIIADDSQVVLGAGIRF